ncbi:putative nitroreductase [Helianthus annuus]|nr:putative nitroreductase [Helianthus annuus]
MKSFHRTIHNPHRLLRPPTTTLLPLTTTLCLPPPQTTMSTSSSSTQHNPEQSSLTQVLTYHNQTKHSFTNYARGPRGLDWDNQPNPFRRYISAPLRPLLHPNSGDSVLYNSLFKTLPFPKPINKITISEFFYDSLALSAWKSTGFSTWSLRVNPSSGLTSVFWRESWKYGERGFRYCNHDVGHAIGAVSMAAAGQGWDVKVLDGLGHDELKKVMGLEVFSEFEIPERAVKGKFEEIEFEHPDCLLLVFPNGIDGFDVNYENLRLAISEFSNLDWKGEPNSLSKEHVCWDIIYRTSEAVKKPLTLEKKFVIDPFEKSGTCSEDSYKHLPLRELVRKRRSAVDMDGVTSIERNTFYQILLHCLPSGCQEKQKRQLGLPYRAMDWDSEVHCVLFVHRVVGLPKGLYFLVRNEEHFDGLKKATRSEFKWEKPEDCPPELPLYELAQMDCMKLSKHLSCHQDIASDGCFSLGMVARVEPTLREKGVWMYPRLFWETGVLGQVLYLEAHAVGISATGIGCFFDDPVHEVLGLTGSNFQSLYHFTIGGPVVDKRITSLPAYPGPGVDA